MLSFNLRVCVPPCVVLILFLSFSTTVHAFPKHPALLRLQTAQSQVSQGDLTAQRRTLRIRSSAELAKSSSFGWQLVNQVCSANPATDTCAQASIAEVNLECTQSSQLFRKGSTTWTWINFGMVVASAAFTGVGASATIANAKVFSTLGASTALGSVATTATTNNAADQGGLLAINSTLDSFLKYIQTGANGQPAANQDIYKSAPIYAAKCTAAAASTGK